MPRVTLRFEPGREFKRKAASERKGQDNRVPATCGL